MMTTREALEKAQAQFQFYADEHSKALKAEKAATNQAMADMCEAAIASYPPALQPPPSDREQRRERIARLDEAWFDEIEEFLDNYSDAEIIDGTTHPNNAMRLLYQLRESR